MSCSTHPSFHIPSRIFNGDFFSPYILLFWNNFADKMYGSRLSSSLSPLVFLQKEKEKQKQKEKQLMDRNPRVNGPWKTWASTGM